MCEVCSTRATHIVRRQAHTSSIFFLFQNAMFQAEAPENRAHGSRSYFLAITREGNFKHLTLANPILLLIDIAI